MIAAVAKTTSLISVIELDASPWTEVLRPSTLGVQVGQEDTGSLLPRTAPWLSPRCLPLLHLIRRVVLQVQMSGHGFSYLLASKEHQHGTHLVARYTRALILQRGQSRALRRLSEPGRMHRPPQAQLVLHQVLNSFLWQAA